MNSVIFLDIDGVCNNKADYSKPRQSDAELLPDRTLQILKRIVDSTGAKIVLSSSWRFRLADVVNNRLGDFGLFLLDKTTTVSLDDPRRAAEIDLWLSNNPDFNAMAILDDDDDAGAIRPECFFQTSFNTGLTDEIADQVIQHLNRK
jgi:hypothetical protein